MSSRERVRPTGFCFAKIVILGPVLSSVSPRLLFFRGNVQYMSDLQVPRFRALSSGVGDIGNPIGWPSKTNTDTNRMRPVRGPRLFTLKKAGGTPKIITIHNQNRLPFFPTLNSPRTTEKRSTNNLHMLALPTSSDNVFLLLFS